MQPWYEVVSGQILLARRREFFRLHSEVLLPVMGSVGISPVLMLITEIGEHGRFLDIYRYESLADYEARTEQLVRHPAMLDYYRQIGECVPGGITVQLMQELPYAGDWT